MIILRKKQFIFIYTAIFFAQKQPCLKVNSLIFCLKSLSKQLQKNKLSAKCYLNTGLLRSKLLNIVAQQLA